ncbi:hypothetical protein CHELA1G11_11375 [Hyphomicrobiales bacterium]|nr:hypothetical protein CHELA1G11_11375 [Hyphomicrobiales bacterium]CAH1668205.1 hypothetical protein CHELA1G2_12934 [Hyphomicrobiales bacterium]
MLPTAVRTAPQLPRAAVLVFVAEIFLYEFFAPFPFFLFLLMPSSHLFLDSGAARRCHTTLAFKRFLYGPAQFVHTSVISEAFTAAYILCRQS